MKTDAKQPRFVEIGDLPDFLSDYTLVGQNESERMLNHWLRWAQSLGGLWTTQQSTFGLFFFWEASRRTVHLYAGASSENDLETLIIVLQSSGIYSIKRCGATLSDLLRSKGHAAPFPYGWLITQGESQLHFSSLGKETNRDSTNYAISGKFTSGFTDKFPSEFRLYEKANEGLQVIYQVHPFWGPGGAFLLPFDVIFQQKSDVLLCVLIRPYTNIDNLRSIVKKLSDVSRECESAAEQYVESPSVGGQRVSLPRRVSDPQLKWCAQVYAAHLRRLTNPFLLFGACFSGNQMAARQVAQAIANTIHEERSFEPPAGEAYFLPQSAQILPLNQLRGSELRSNQELFVGTILNMCLSLSIDEQFLVRIPSRALSLVPQQNPEPLASQPKPNASQSESRQLLPAILRYLCDARGAATLFRFPVNINSGIPGIVVRQRPPDFHPGVLTSVQQGDRSISIGRLRTGNPVEISVDDLCKHALVVGTTGSGKTNTALNIVHQLAQHKIPFMVIESAKKEYRSLLSLMENQLRIYTVGNELCSPIRINPFELLEGVRVESHISRLQTCFEAALPQDFGSLSSILAEALHNTYAQKGWSELDVYSPDDTREFPMMEDFISAVSQVIDKRYRGEIQQNMRGVLLGRLEPFRLGSKRRMFNVLRSEPSIETLFNNPVILELDELNLDEKALFALFLIVFLREYCDRKRQITSKLQHIMLIEEAHNVLEQVGSVGSEGTRADTRHKAVQAFCQMLAEIRAFGEGLIIVDQSPVKLARDAIRNTNIQIVHLLRDSHDREAMTTAMIMDPLQSEYVGKLRVGEAAIFYPGLEKSTFIRTDAFKPEGYKQNISDEEIKTRMKDRSEVRPLPHRGCERCTARCEFQEQARKQLMTAAKDINRFLSDFAAAEKTEERERILHKFTDMLWEKGENKLDYAWCIFVQYYAKYNNTKHPLRFVWDSLKRKEESVR